MNDGPEIQFPCTFPIKIMGRDTPEFHKTVNAILTAHLGSLDPECIQKRPSSHGHFISLTVTFEAQSRGQLDALYQDLTRSEAVLMAL